MVGVRGRCDLQSAVRLACRGVCGWWIISSFVGYRSSSRISASRFNDTMGFAQAVFVVQHTHWSHLSLIPPL